MNKKKKLKKSLCDSSAACTGLVGWSPLNSSTDSVYAVFTMADNFIGNFSK